MEAEIIKEYLNRGFTFAEIARRAKVAPSTILRIYEGQTKNPQKAVRKKLQSLHTSHQRFLKRGLQQSEEQ